MASHRRKNLIESRRRVEDEGEEEGGPDAGDLDDDSLSDGSVISDEEDAADGSETSQVDDSPLIAKGDPNGHTEAAKGESRESKISTTRLPPKQATKLKNGTSDTEMMMNGLKIAEHNSTAEEVHFDDFHEGPQGTAIAPSPAVVKSTTQIDQQHETPLERRRREHEEYKKKRDADPAFVPNRGAFFMHDHRHAGPAANGFRPFGRGRGRGGRPAIGGPFAPVNNFPQPVELTDAPWTHDMHDAVNQIENRALRGPSAQYGYNNGIPQPVPQAPRGTAPNRSLSTIKHVGNVQIRVFLDGMKEPIKLPPIAFNQYTRLPDHRPPLRRDKPVRISLPDNPPRYIFPAVERSFIFIPRAMRPNQQGFGSRNRGRLGLGSVGGYSRRTSIYDGSMYGGGSVYTPSLAMSRRSSLAFEMPRDTLISPTGSTRPIVRLPPPNVPQISRQPSVNCEQQTSMVATESSSIDDLPRPQSYPLPQKPTFRENRPNAIPMHQPRPQKAVSVADIESPASLSFNPPQQYQQPFHQQVPAQINGNGYSHESINPHSRNASYPSQESTGTPLSQIPERAIHALPFQPNTYQQQQSFYPQQYQMMPQQQNFYYPQQYSSGMAAQAPPFVSASSQQTFSAPPQQPDAAQLNNLVAQEVNGMVYYYDASQIPAVATFPAYPTPQSYPMQQVNMGGMMTPSPDGFYYPQAPPQGVVYYPQ